MTKESKMNNMKLMLTEQQKKESQELGKKMAEELVKNLNKQVKEFYRAEDLAEKLDVNIMTIYRYIKAGRLKAYKIGKEYRIDKNEFQLFLKSVSTK